MKNKYRDLIQQTFDWPQTGFDVDDDGNLYFHDIPLMDIIDKYGTPLKITCLPNISEKIQKARRLFNVAMAKVDYDADYYYCYCTKSNHFEFVMREALKNDVHIETSSAFDINIIDKLYQDGVMDKSRYVVCNGYKRSNYLENIARLVNEGFSNTVCVLDNLFELDALTPLLEKDCYVGMRIAAEEEPNFAFYTSRLGIRYNDIVPYYETSIKNHPKVKLKMLHFFLNTGIKDTSYYWNELMKAVNVYCALKKIAPDLTALNIGGGFPFQNSLNFNYDYDYMAEEIIAQIKAICQQNEVPEPDIFTEFGSYTVAESGAMLYRIINQKQQNDRERWNMIDSSFLTTLPDTLSINQRFIQLSINNWNMEYERVNLGGLTCDSNDFYNAELHQNAIFLPKFDEDSPLYIGFFHTGAYQEAIGGYGGVQHCLNPAPKHVIIDRDEDGEIVTKLFAKEQSYQSMLRILGY
ncbi:MAG: arginine decarboxylase [Bacteroidales bacterium]|jgi:arginine decarboxylase|nr:arginine decarboxylase [Bacteroidales bacterium]